MTARFKEYLDMVDKLTQEGKLKQDQWVDHSGHFIGWSEFESMESLAQMWSLENMHKFVIELFHLVDNVRFRLLRPGNIRMLDFALTPP